MKTNVCFWSDIEFAQFHTYFSPENNFIIPEMNKFYVFFIYLNKFYFYNYSITN